MSILEGTLVPFIEAVYPEGHKFMMDNDPKHISGYAAEWMSENAVNWWKTPGGKLLPSPQISTLLRTFGMN